MSQTTEANEPPRRRPGRPRSEAARRAILDATNRLLDTIPVRDLTIEAIAREAGVGKPTIYRWWPSKNAVVIDAAFGAVAKRIEYPELDSAVESLAQQVSAGAAVLRSRTGRVLAEILAEGQSDPDTLASFNERVLDVRRADARAVIERGQQSGEIAPEVDVEVAIDLIWGPLYYRLLAGHAPPDERFAAETVAWALRGLSPS
jgi:AcrR family transcriptional regulator